MEAATVWYTQHLGELGGRNTLARVDHVYPMGYSRCGFSELKLDFGPGYRVYCTERKGELVLLCGGD